MNTFIASWRKTGFDGVQQYIGLSILLRCGSRYRFEKKIISYTEYVKYVWATKHGPKNKSKSKTPELDSLKMKLFPQLGHKFK